MASVVEICNRALQKIGSARITSLTDQSVNARACNTAYYSVRDALLRSHRWAFAIQRFALAQAVTSPAFGPANAYPLPAGWLKILDPDVRWNYNDRDWVVENNCILTNWVPPLHVRLVMKVEDPNQMDPAFREALSAYLSQELCEALTQSNDKKKAAAQDAKDSIAEAKKCNAIEQVPQIAAEDTWITARM